MQRLIVVSLLVAAASYCVVIATMTAAPKADEPAGFCKAGVSDDVLHAIPPNFAEQAKRLFDLHMPDAMVQKTTVYRCMDGKVLLCNAGANLPCGKADIRRSLPGATAWCREHPGSDFIPMFATGHDTIYRWRCTGSVARIAGDAEPVDARGFLVRYWKPAD